MAERFIEYLPPKRAVGSERDLLLPGQEFSVNLEADSSSFTFALGGGTVNQGHRFEIINDAGELKLRNLDLKPHGSIVYEVTLPAEPAVIYFGRGQDKDNRLHYYPQPRQEEIVNGKTLPVMIYEMGGELGRGVADVGNLGMNEAKIITKAHLKIIRGLHGRDNLVLKDMGSTNGTWVNREGGVSGEERPEKETGRLEKQGRGLVAGMTNTGIVREHNEDAFVISGSKENCSYSLDESETDRTRVEKALEAIKEAGGRLGIVADGMGGHGAGEKASAMVIMEITESLAKFSDWKSLLSEEELKNLSEKEQVELVNSRVAKRLTFAVQSANQKIFQFNKRFNENAGTTLTMSLMVDNKAHIANVGDSRTYLVEKDGSLERLTTDHSLVERLVATGQITREEARNHPEGNIIYRFLGGKPTVDVDIFTRELQTDQNLLLCSDGLWEMLREEQMEAVIKQDGSSTQVCERLVNAANQAGGGDNISVVFASQEKREKAEPAAPKARRPQEKKRVRPAAKARSPQETGRPEERVAEAKGGTARRLPERERLEKQPSLPRALRELANMLSGSVELDKMRFFELLSMVWDNYLEREELSESQFKLIFGLIRAARRRGIKITLTGRYLTSP